MLHHHIFSSLPYCTTAWLHYTFLYSSTLSTLLKSTFSLHFSSPHTLSLHFSPLLYFTVCDVGTVSTAAGMSTSTGAHSECSPSNSINFRDIEIGRTETRIIYLRNESERETHYSILSEENGIFKITGKQGSIPANCNGHPVRYDKSAILSIPLSSRAHFASFSSFHRPIIL